MAKTPEAGQLYLDGRGNLRRHRKPPEDRSAAEVGAKLAALVQQVRSTLESAAHPTGAPAGFHGTNREKEL